MNYYRLPNIDDPVEMENMGTLVWTNQNLLLDIDDETIHETRIIFFAMQEIFPYRTVNGQKWYALDKEPAHEAYFGNILRAFSILYNPDIWQLADEFIDMCTSNFTYINDDVLMGRAPEDDPDKMQHNLASIIAGMSKALEETTRIFLH